MKMKSALLATTLAATLSLTAGVANASVYGGSIDVYNGMTPTNVHTSTTLLNTEPSFYELIVGPFDATVSLLQIDTTDDEHTVFYEIWTDTIAAVGSANYALGSLVDSWSALDRSDDVPVGPHTLALAAGNYVLKITTNGAFSSTSQISAVPLPGAALLFGSAILGAGVIRRKKKADMAAA